MPTVSFVYPDGGQVTMAVPGIPPVGDMVSARWGDSPHRVNITIDTLRRLANALGVLPCVLLRKAKLSPAKPGRPRKRLLRQ